MALFDFNGLEELAIDLKELGDIPDSTLDDMLMAGGEVIQRAHQEALVSMGLVKSRTLHDSIKIMKRRKGSQRYVRVYPAGEHHLFTARVKTYTKYNWGRKGDKPAYTKGGTKTATNNDVGFVHEFGAPKRRIPAKQWMRTANEKHADEAVEAEFRVYDNYLRSKGL